jgi:hypothetical protein
MRVFLLTDRYAGLTALYKPSLIAVQYHIVLFINSSVDQQPNPFCLQNLLQRIGSYYNPELQPSGGYVLSNSLSDSLDTHSHRQRDPKSAPHNSNYKTLF